MNYYPTITGIFQGDLVVKTAIELAIEDIRKNPWLIEDIFGSLIENPYLNHKYGMKEINRAKEFIINNAIPVYMRHRLDKQEFPCITISVGNSNEAEGLAVLGDVTPFVDVYDADEIGKKINYIVTPFQPVSYDTNTGILELPTDLENYQYVSKGMVAIDPDTGNGYIIQGKAGENGVQLITGANITGKIGIIPQYQVYRARREKAVSQESYNIGCHVEGDASTLIFLHSVVKYALWRYKEGLLEANNFQISKLSCTDLIKNDAFGVENVYSRWITLTGQIEESWVKTPYRIIEAVDFTDNTAEIKAGIKICTNVDTQDQNQDQIWTTINSEESE